MENALKKRRREDGHLSRAEYEHLSEQETSRPVFPPFCVLYFVFSCLFLVVFAQCWSLFPPFYTIRAIFLLLHLGHFQPVDCINLQHSIVKRNTMLSCML